MFPLGAVGALSPSTLSPLSTQGTGAGASVGGARSSFAATLADLASNTTDTLRNAEAMSTQALQGKADTREVVDAVMGAEQALQTAVAIRDKIVTAYLEVSRMQI
ncbi:MAG: flagellar hook-basal body complex protein FliE [Mesorhizobium amorphae]|nr:MAG: flagellar hook-basal body complex protein FliE [Mesorhizobium amorphae]